ncbi:MAG: dihydropteroate synthase [Methanomassiliicoccaceae archaeon]|nr:dihydropteroate synthase [Methanomassiliicoccaceae archaeon]
MTATEWRRYSLKYDAPKIMGIINLTPDSFSDTVRYSGKEAVNRIFEMEDEGADIIDVGGESTRPGSLRVSPAEEISRIISVIKETAPSLKVPISADTMNPETAEAALNAGVAMINDIGGLRDERMMNIVASAGVPVVIVHMHGVPQTMQDRPMHGNVIEEISKFFDDTCSKAAASGVSRKMMILDPGIGFGKTSEQNIRMIENLRTLKKGYPLLTGTSMKSFLASAYPGMPRYEASIMSAKECIRNGADIVRVHDIKGTLNALRKQ